MLDLGLSHWLLAVLAGGLVGMDAVSGPQIMISRPIVSGTVGGALFGDPAAGFLVGAVLEVFGFRHPPLGAARYADLGPAGLMAGAGYAVAGGGVAALTVVLVAGWALGWLGSRTVVGLRRINGRLVSPDGLAAVPARLEVRQRLGLLMDFLRGALLTAAFLVPMLMLARITAVEPGQPGRRLAVVSLIVAVGGAAGAGGRNMTAGGRALLLLLGGALAAALWVSLT